MPFLNPARFRSLLRRKGEQVLVFSALPLSSRASGQATYQRGQTLALEPGQAILHGYIYHPLEFSPTSKVWIEDASRSRAQTATGVMEGSANSVSWMPDEYSLSSPDLLVRVQEEGLDREQTTVPPDGDALELTRPYVFDVLRVSQGSSLWRVGEHFTCESAGQKVGVLQGAGVVLNWTSGDRPAVGSPIAVEERFHPVVYLSGEAERGGMRSRYGDQSSLSSLLPRNARISYVHPDAEVQKDA